MKKIALVDCNNFYASCERIFRPDLKTRPIVVLSNNDGCVISRSDEAKALGIKMAVPFYQVQHFVEQKNLAVFSANFALYADMSNRAISLMKQFVEKHEVYSIDECFLDLSDTPNFEENMHTLYQNMLNWIGLPVCIGIGTTKTLAKLANHIAKKQKSISPICNLFTYTQKDFSQALEQIYVREIWGVGSNLSKQLAKYGIYTAKDLAEANPQIIRNRFSVMLERTVLELQGISCLEIEEVHEPKKQIISSRAFGNRITSIKHLEEAIYHFAFRATEKLRIERLLCTTITIYIRTSHYIHDDLYQAHSATLTLSSPTDNVLCIAKEAKKLLKDIYQPNIAYYKAGVLLSGFVPKANYTPSLFSKNTYTHDAKLMSTIEEIHKRFGKEKLRIAGEGIYKKTSAPWHGKLKNRSPRYTTDWDELAYAHAK